MNIIETLTGEYLSMVFGGIAGIATAWITQRTLNKRGVFSYFVHHNKIGVSSDDPIFGKVSVTWNNLPIQHLYLSTIELKNESLNDYENVIIQTYTSDTKLLNESTYIVNSPKILELTDEYKKKIHVNKGEEPTDTQFNIYRGQREYIIPVFNRGQVIKINYLNSANTENTPNIWLSSSVKGVKVKFQVPQRQVFGVSQPRAALVGALLGLLSLIPLTYFFSNTWVVGFLALAFGFFVVIPGAYTVKAYRFLREAVGG